MLKITRHVAQISVWIGGLAMIGIAFIVSTEVILRKIFLIGLSAASDLSSYTLAISTAWGLSFALLNRAHVRVDALVHLLPRRVAAFVDILALVALTWLASVLAWHGFNVFAESFTRNSRAMTPLETPMWIPQGLWVAGLAMFLASCLVLLVVTLRLLARGQIRQVNELIGTLTVEEEAESEIKDALAYQRDALRSDAHRDRH